MLTPIGHAKDIKVTGIPKIMTNFLHASQILLIAITSFGDATLHPSIHWNPRNPLFGQNVEIAVHLNSKLNILCPHSAIVLNKQDACAPQEDLYENMWMVGKQEYESCKVNKSSAFSQNLLLCNTPNELKYYAMVFKEYSAGGLEFEPGTRYYFIATSNGTNQSLSNEEGGHCETSNGMKMSIYVCNGSFDPSCAGSRSLFPSASTIYRTRTEIISNCTKPTISSAIFVPKANSLQFSSVITSSSPPNPSPSTSSSMLVPQSSPVDFSSAITSRNINPPSSPPSISSAILVPQSSPDEFSSTFTSISSLGPSSNISSAIPVLQSSPIKFSSAVTSRNPFSSSTSISSEIPVLQSSPVEFSSAFTSISSPGPSPNISLGIPVPQSSSIEFSLATMSRSPLSLSPSIPSAILVPTSNPVEFSSAFTTISPPGPSAKISLAISVSQSSPIEFSSASTSITPPGPSPSISLSIPVTQSSAFTSISSANPSPSNGYVTSQIADHCQKKSIPDEFYSLYINQTQLLTAIFNYTSMIPDLQLLIQRMNSSLSETEEKEPQITNTTQNCTNSQSNQSQAMAPPCRHAIQAPVLRNCSEIYDAGFTVSGIYRVDPSDGQGAFGVFCDQQTASGGWTLLLRRFDGSLTFDRGKKAYVYDGLGDITGEYLMALEKIRRLTGANPFTLRFDLEAPDGEKRYAEYSGTLLGDLASKFKITVGEYSGNAGDSFSYHNEMKFTTKQWDNDKSGSNCAITARGGWWFKDCQPQACLTGLYENGTHSTQGIVGIRWLTWKNANFSLARVEMKIRPG